MTATSALFSDRIFVPRTTEELEAVIDKVEEQHLNFAYKYFEGWKEEPNEELMWYWLLYWYAWKYQEMEEIE